MTAKIAEKIIGKINTPSFKTYELRDKPVFCKTYGAKHIESSAKQQMELANLLPISVQGALNTNNQASQLIIVITYFT